MRNSAGSRHIINSPLSHTHLHMHRGGCSHESCPFWFSSPFHTINTNPLIPFLIPYIQGTFYLAKLDYSDTPLHPKSAPLIIPTLCRYTTRSCVALCPPAHDTRRPPRDQCTRISCSRKSKRSATAVVTAKNTSSHARARALYLRKYARDCKRRG